MVLLPEVQDGHTGWCVYTVFVPGTGNPAGRLPPTNGPGRAYTGREGGIPWWVGDIPGRQKGLLSYKTTVLREAKGPLFIQNHCSQEGRKGLFSHKTPVLREAKGSLLVLNLRFSGRQEGLF